MRLWAVTPLPLARTATTRPIRGALAAPGIPFAAGATVRRRLLSPYTDWALASVLALFVWAVPALAAPVAYVGATLIDGTGDAPVAEATVIVDGGRIVAAGPSSSTPVPADAERLDVRGKWLLPGLIDAHIHFFQSGGAFARPDILDLRALRPYPDEVAAVRAALPQTLARTLASGITSVVDAGGPFWTFDVRDLAETLAVAPRVAVAGPLLTPRFPPQLATDDPPMIQIAAVEQALVEARRVLARKPDLLKIWFIEASTDMVAEQRWIAAVMQEAHAVGVRVAVHATDLRLARAAVDLGADILVHSVDDAVADAQFFFGLRARGVVYTPTLAVTQNYSRALGLSFVPSAAESRLGDSAAIQSIRALAQMPPSQRPAGVRPAAAAPLNANMVVNLRRAREAGVVIAAGSDAGNIGTLHGPGLHREMELMVVAGMTPMQVLVAATKGSAVVLGRSDVGTVEAGKLADLLLLDADPLVDIRNTSRIFAVVRGGTRHDPNVILQSLR